MAIINVLPHTPLPVTLIAPVSLAARTIVFPGPAIGIIAGSRAVTGTVPGSLSGAGPVFGTVPFALALAGSAAVALPGTATPTIPLASAATTSTATGHKDIHAIILEISSHLVCGLGSGRKPANGITRTGIRAKG